MLVVEAYDKTGRERLDSVGCRKASDIFASLLHRMCPADHHLNLTFIQPADSVQQVAEVGELSRFDGVVWTGSSLTIHDDVPEVTRQLELARRFFEPTLLDGCGTDSSSNRGEHILRPEPSMEAVGCEVQTHAAASAAPLSHGSTGHPHGGAPTPRAPS